MDTDFSNEVHGSTVKTAGVQKFEIEMLGLHERLDNEEACLCLEAPERKTEKGR